MKARILLLPSLLGCLLCGAAALDLNGDFAKLNADGSPVNWTLHRNWAGYKPFAAIELVQDAGLGGRAIHVSDIKSRYGMCVRTVKRMPGACGDQVSVVLSVKGRGKGWVDLYRYTADGSWNQTTGSQELPLTDAWQEHSFTFVLGNGTAGETASFDVVFGAEQGAECYAGRIAADLQKGAYQGDAAFPREWRVFAPLDRGFAPTAAQLAEIPDVLGGVSPREVQLQAGAIDLAAILGRQQEGACCWAYAAVESPIECDYTIGAGADWWMQYHVNGQAVIDTMTLGNVKFPYAIDNHLATVRLRKGRNILAVRFVAGSKSSVLMLGGPRELRRIVKDVTVDGTVLADDFDDPKAARIGNPLLIQGNPTPGLTTVTGQAVYSAAAGQAVELKSCEARMPGDRAKWFATGIRIQGFGRGKRATSTLSYDFRRAGGVFAQLQVRHVQDDPLLACVFLDRGKVVKEERIPYKTLPADFVFAVSRDGACMLRISSLADSSVARIPAALGGFAEAGDSPFTAAIGFAAGAGAPAEVVVDEYFVGSAVPGRSTGQVPFRIALEDTFDPVKAGWKLVFDDEFDGREVDWSKWFPHRNRDFASLDGQGHLRIKADLGADGRSLDTVSMWSREKFGYGYFEARVRYTRQPGWWAAFWLYGDVNANPMLDGFEIDVFEDYYTRKRQAGPDAGAWILDHNFHVYTGGTLKSWNYLSPVPGSFEEFHTLGCKWTPFEISYYHDGRLIKSTAAHSPYSSVTFDAFSHAAGIRPLHAIVSGQLMDRSWFAHDTSKGKYPEYYLVDHVRVYEMPTDRDPRVAIAGNPHPLFARAGETLVFDAVPTVNPKTGAPIRDAYLFDNGYLVAHQDKPPYRFSIPFTPGFYQATRYMRPGRAGKKPSFEGYSHVFVAYVQDSLGNVAHSEPVVKVVRKDGESRPYQGKAHPVPGRFSLGEYDEGGPGVAYQDTSKGNSSNREFRQGEDVDASPNGIGFVNSGEWLSYTVDIEKAGKYTAELLHGTPFFGEQNVILHLDGTPIGTFRIFQHDSPNWTCDSTAVLKDLDLPAGRHVVTLFLIGGFNAASLEFQRM